jgi:hypothetical protein
MTKTNPNEQLLKTNNNNQYDGEVCIKTEGLKETNKTKETTKLSKEERKYQVQLICQQV